MGTYVKIHNFLIPIKLYIKYLNVDVLPTMFTCDLFDLAW